jgi:vancomycin resistance protein YoaR
MRRSWLFWFAVGSFVGILVSLLVAGGLFWAWQRSDRLASGVIVDGVPIGNLPIPLARQRLQSALTKWQQLPVTLVVGEEPIQTFSAQQLGIAPDVDATLQDAYQIGRRPSPLDSWRELLDASRNGRTVNWRWQLSERMAVETLRRLADRLNRPPQRAWVEWENGQVRIIPSQDGQRLDIAATLESWRQRLAEGRWRTLPLVVRKERPEVTTEDVAVIDGVVGEATTFFKAWERNRSHNIRLAAQRLDHVFIPPGETISFNELVGPRTRRRGFRIARVLVRGRFTQDFGGGVCQVSGTLYNAALKAGMKVVQRHRHSRPIGYLPAGLDATVDFGKLDLRLQNPFPTPLYLRTFVRGGRLTILILGKRQDGVTYRLVRQVTRFGTKSEKQIPDPTLPPGRTQIVDKGSIGYRVTVWRWRLENGVVTEREFISHDIYAPQPRLLRVGISRGMNHQPAPEQKPSEQIFQPVSDTGR